MHTRRVIFAALVVACLAAGAAALEADRIYLGGATLDVGEMAAPDAAAIARAGEAGQASLWILHYCGVASVDDRVAVMDAGAEILGYLPVHAYTVRATPEEAARLAELPGVDLVVAFAPEWKLDPALTLAEAGEMLDLVLSFAPGAPLDELAYSARDLGAEVLSASTSAHRPRLGLRADASIVEELSRLPGLIWMSEARPITPRNDEVRWITQSAVTDQTPIWDQGLHGEGQIVGHIDSELDRYNCWFDDPEDDPVGPDHRKVVFVGSHPNGYGNHGTHTAGTLAGDAFPMGGGTGGRGLAYEARMAHSNYVSAGSYDFYTDLVLHEQAGARVHSNSWGIDYVTSYTEYCYDIDLFSWEYEENLVAVAITNVFNELFTPENAKNVLAVAGTGTGADFDLHCKGGVGPTADGRRKPEILTPGCSVQSAYANQNCALLSKSGTSMACPSATAGAALVRQYFTEGWYPSGVRDERDALVPSGALLRAVLLNSTSKMADPLYPDYPDTRLGWGRLLLDEALYFAGESRQLWVTDPRHVDGLESGQTREYNLDITDPSEPLEITLVYSDYPGEVGAPFPVVNDLDLVVLGPSGTYLGNVFDLVAGESQTGGARDELNNVERVVISSPATGPWQIQVHAPEVNWGPQGFALAINATLESTPVVVSLFRVEAGEAAVDLAWELAEDSDPGDFRLEVEHAGTHRALAFVETAPGRYAARDEDPSLLAGGRFTYTLSANEGGDWQLLRSESVEIAATVPETRLLGAHPNPFNPHTTVRILAAGGERLRVEVFDLSGRRVARLADRVFPAGRHSIAWRGEGDDGHPLASGVYLARLEGPSVSQAEKLILLR